MILLHCHYGISWITLAEVRERMFHGRAGEEVTHRYSWSIERNDKALMNYFFVHQRSPPRLCTADLPGGSVWDDNERSPPQDDIGSPDGIPVSQVKFQISQCKILTQSLPEYEAGHMPEHISCLVHQECLLLSGAHLYVPGEWEGEGQAGSWGSPQV